jgi:type II secretory pathway pseudopilin PulG
MKLHSIRNRKAAAFTLIEMIGVLAVIAILAALLVPKVFNAINNARINNAVVSVQTVKTALADHYAKYGSIPVDGSTTPPTVLTPPQEQFDLVLMRESLLDKPFAVKIGDGISSPANTRIEVVNISGLSTGSAVAAAAGGGDTTGYALAGGSTNSITGSALVQAVITGVNESDAQQLSSIVDGPSMTSTNLGVNDYSGRVKYTSNSGNPVTAYVYITHR